MGRLRVVRLMSAIVAPEESKGDHPYGLKVVGCSPQVRKANGGVCPMPGKEVTTCNTGILIAHDLVEHQNGVEGIGPVWDELEALGGIWYTRSGPPILDGAREHWALFEPATPYASTAQERIHADLAWFFDAWLAEGGGGMDARGEYPSYAPYVPPLVHLEEWPWGYGALLKLTGEFSPHVWKLYLGLARTCFRRGVASMRIRFPAGSEQAARLWINIRDTIAGILPEVDSEGQTWSLAFDEGTGECRCFRDRVAITGIAP